MIWATAFKLSGKEDYVFPPPWHVARAFWEGVLDLSFLKSVGASLLRAFCGFIAALGIGVVLGLLLPAAASSCAG